MDVPFWPLVLALALLCGAVWWNLLIARRRGRADVRMTCMACLIVAMVVLGILVG